jgi:type 1 glutamine amidotransferase
MFTRREMLRTTGAAAVAASLSGLAFGRAPAEPDLKKKRLLVFTRSQGFQHDVVKIVKGKPSLVDRTWTDLAAKHGFEIHCTKDGRIFEPDAIAKFDAFFFYTTGDLTEEKSADGTPPMSRAGKKALLDAVAGGKGFLGSHCATDTFHSADKDHRWLKDDPDKLDPYIAMIGGEFIKHGDQQAATMRVVDSTFPGLRGVTDFRIKEEWYSLKDFQPDLHVLLVQETAGMKGPEYQRPDFPATWARMHHKGRVFYTSLGHREDVWSNPLFQNLLMGALSWAAGTVDADISPNLKHAAPEAGEVPKEPKKEIKKK